MSNKSTIQIRIGTVEVTCEGDQLEEVLRGLKSQLPELMQPERAAGPSARELLEQSQARTFGEKAGVVAYWLEHHRGRRDWRSGDIVDVLRDCGEPSPANITDALNQKLKKNLFEVHDRRWRLTGEGRGWVRFQLLNEREED
jgi:hypothetical protein